MVGVFEATREDARVLVRSLNQLVSSCSLNYLSRSKSILAELFTRVLVHNEVSHFNTCKSRLYTA